MNSLVALLLSAFLVSASTGAFAQWTEINNTGRTNFAMQMFNSDVGYLSSDAGLLKTEDGWKNFSLCSNPYDIWAFDFIDDLSGVIIYTNVDQVETGYGLTSNNCNWNYSSKSIGGGYTTLFVSDSGTIYFNIKSDQFVVGKNWMTAQDTVQLDSTNSILDILFYDQNNGIVSTVFTHGHDRKVLKTDDGGDNWTTVLRTDTGITMIKEVNGITFLSGEKGLLKKSLDNGASWKTIQTPFTFDLVGFHFISKDTGFVYGGSFEVSNEYGKIFKTFDGGASWSEITPMDVTEAVTGAYFLSGNEGYIAEKTGKIYYTETGGGDFLGTINHEGQKESISIQIFPNPAKDELNIVLPVEGFNSDQQVIIRDVAGKVLEIKTFDSSKGTIETTAFAPGVYFIQIGSEYLKFQVL